MAIFNKNFCKKAFSIINFKLLLASLITLTPVISTASSSILSDPVDYRNKQEQQQDNNPYVISFYKPTYVLPAYYNSSPYYSVYQNHLPDQQNLKKYDFKFQISFKVPILRNLFDKENALYAAYTQSSFWQAYGTSPYFRETDYEPEIFIANTLNIPLISNWQMKLFNVGIIHQSNGYGGILERTWNRAYVEAIASNTNWLVSIKPWVVITDPSYRSHNLDFTHYLGHGRLLVAYKYNEHTLSLESRNNFESGFKHGMLQLGWSFPLTKKVKGYIQTFSGYGQSLIEYNHYSNSIGVGIALNDWI